MCGIIGYIGPRDAAAYLLDGLRRLEYRGYDSAGVATIDGDTLLVTKRAGRLAVLAQELADHPSPGNVGIGHTRWATHGAATDANAHPHVGGPEGAIAVVHNGVIENFRTLKTRLESEGYTFRSATDTEVIAHLVASCLEEQLASGLDVPIGGLECTGTVAARHRPLVEAVRRAVAQLQGTYGLVVLFRDYPDVMIAARLGSPLVVGVGNGEHLVASDASPLAGYTDQIVYLADHQLAVVTAESLAVIDRDQGHVSHTVRTLELAAEEVVLDGYPHYMLKEIFEQPETIRNAMRGRLSLDEATAVFGGLNLTPRQLRSVNRILLTACGTSWHAALVGEYVLEELAQIPVEVEYASELRYRNPPVDHNTLLFAITQSGETADTLAALREMKRKGHPTLAICNVVGSSIAQAADGGIYLHAGTEIGVASTKAFTSQCVVLAMLALYFGRLRNLSFDAGIRIIERLQALPDQVARALKTNDAVHEIAKRYSPLHQLPVPGSVVQLSHGTGRRAQAQGNQLHPCRGLSRRGNEARAHRPGRRAHAQRVPDSARRGLRQGDVEPGRDQSPRRARDRDRRRRRYSRQPIWPTTSSKCPTWTTSCSRSSPASRCSSWPITSRSCAAATSTSPATWQKA